MTENVVQMPLLVQEATSLLASAVTSMEFEIQGVVGRHSLPQNHPDNLSTLAVDIFHTNALNMIGYVIGSYRLVLVSNSKGNPSVERVAAEMEAFIHRFQAEMTDASKRPRVGYLWRFLIVGLHHLLLEHFGFPLYSGEVPSLEELSREEEARMLWDRAAKSAPPNSRLLN